MLAFMFDDVLSAITHFSVTKKYSREKDFRSMNMANKMVKKIFERKAK